MTLIKINHLVFISSILTIKQLPKKILSLAKKQQLRFFNYYYFQVTLLVDAKQFPTAFKRAEAYLVFHSVHQFARALSKA